MKKILFLSLALLALNAGSVSAMKEDDAPDYPGKKEFEQALKYANKRFTQDERDIKEQKRLARNAINNIAYVRWSGMGAETAFENMYNAAREDIAGINTRLTNYYTGLKVN